MKHFLSLLISLLLAPLAALHAEPIAGKRPNIVFILTDDQGYGDISAHGNPVLKTPNLDKLHHEGVRFTDFHVSPTCSPTRSALLTGRHEFKNGVTHTILERERLTLKATTIAQVLQSAGYTTGIFGKWHLGDEAEYQPNRRGFDEVYIHGGGGIGQIYPGSCGDAPGNKYFDPAILHNGKFEKTKGYCTDLFYAQATQWIDAQRQAKKPFFAYIPSNTPHGPLVARPQDKAVYEGQGLSDSEESFFGMIHNIDQNVGKLLAKLDEWGIAKDTLVVFMNDNGGTAGAKVFNAGMRGTKGTAWLGGTRASSFWRWPGTLQPADCGALAAHIDFFSTLAELAGAKIPDAVKPQVEGRSLVPLLSNPAAKWEDRYLFSHFGRWPKFADPNDGKFKMAAVRNTRWAMVNDAQGGPEKWQLFDLKTDYSQQHNVIEQHPDVAQELRAAFDRWWAECLPLMVNEQVVGPEINPFQTLYYQQFGGSPTPGDLERMKPNRPNAGEAPKGKQEKDKPAPTKRAKPRAAEPASTDDAPRGKPYVYKQSAGKPRQMELYFPPGHDPTKAKAPGLILFHGGGWSGGTLAQFRTAGDYFARRGLVCATAEYQMLSNQESKQRPQGETKKRVCITDAKSAIRWFKQHADELGVDPQRIVTGGGSAGGHIAVLATTNPGLNDPADSKAIDTRVVAYLLFNPAFALDDSNDPEVDVTRFLRRDLAPAVVFFGTDDKWKEGWDVAHAKLKSLGNTTTDLQLASGRAHGFFNKEPWRTVTLIAADRFLAKLGLLAGEPTLEPPATGEKLIAAPASP